MNCVNHEQTEAAGMCTYCGRPFCKDCLVEVKGKLYCKGDLDKVFDENKNSPVASAPQINITNTSSNINTNTNQNSGMIYLQKKKITALLLCIFLGCLGGHRFYVGKTGTGILYLLTLGFYGIGVVIDLILIIIGAFRDKAGYPLI